MKERNNPGEDRTNPDVYIEAGFVRGVMLLYGDRYYYGSLIIFGGKGGYISQIFIASNSLFFRSASANPDFSSWDSWVKVV